MSRIDIAILLGRHGKSNADIVKLLQPITKNLNDIYVALDSGHKPDLYPTLGSIANDVQPVSGSQFVLELHEFRKFMEEEDVEVVDKAWNAIQLIAMSVALTSDEECENVNSHYQSVAQEWAMRRHLMTRGTEGFHQQFLNSR
jgi:hypothetical protein